MQQHLQQRIFLKKGSREILQIPDQLIVCLGPVHGKVVAVLIALHGVGEVPAVGTIGDHKQLQVFEEGVFLVETLLGIAVYLIERFPDSHTPLL